jgi:hypothetical protein
VTKVIKVAAKKICYQIRKFKPFESILAAIRLMLSLPEMDLGARFTKQDNPSFLQEIDPIYRLTLIKG